MTLDSIVTNLNSVLKVKPRSYRVGVALGEWGRGRSNTGSVPRWRRHPITLKCDE